MITFKKHISKMSEGELRKELIVTRQIIDDIYAQVHQHKRDTNAIYLLNQVGRICYRRMPE